MLRHHATTHYTCTKLSLLCNKAQEVDLPHIYSAVHQPLDTNFPATLCRRPTLQAPTSTAARGTSAPTAPSAPGTFSYLDLQAPAQCNAPTTNDNQASSSTHVNRASFLQ